MNDRPNPLALLTQQFVREAQSVEPIRYYIIFDTDFILKCVDPIYLYCPIIYSCLLLITNLMYDSDIW